jgi:hypothetical protein
VPQRLPRNHDDIPKVVQKLCSASEKGYIDLGLVYLLISFFEVPKGLTDIWMVYDGTKSGLDEVLWAPWFPLPTIDSFITVIQGGILDEGLVPRTHICCTPAVSTRLRPIEIRGALDASKVTGRDRVGHFGFA